jgi:HlyD family secretion protein
MDKKLRSSLWKLLLGVIFLAGCSTANAAPLTAGEIPLVVDQFAVVAEGRLTPSSHVELAFSAAGQVAEVFVKEGDIVESGQVIARLRNRERFEAEVATAHMELTNAQIALDELIAQADVASTQAQLELANARDDLRSAEYKWNVQQEGNRASTATMEAAEAKLVLTEKALERAQDEFNGVSHRPDDDEIKAFALANVSAARQQRDAALRTLNWYTGHPTEIQQGILDAELASAEARVAEAERTWEKVKDGPDPQALAVAEERVALAKAMLKAAEAALAETELVAPFGGTIASISLKAGQPVPSGQVVVIIADFERWIIETDDLTEIELPKIRVGQPVTVEFDSLSDMVFDGVVESISPYYELKRGDVTYTVKIAIEQIDPRLQWGMTSVVNFEKEDLP